MNFLGPLFVLVCLVALARYYWKLLIEDEDEAAYSWRWFLTWLGKGVLLPTIAWMMLNIGSTPVLPAIVRVAPPTSTGGFAGFVHGLGYTMAQTGPALVAVSSFWAAVTFGWFVVLISRQSENRRGFIISSLVWCGLISPIVGLMVYLFGWGGLGFGLLFWFWPIAHYSLLLKSKADPVPSYGHAIGKLKFGKYREAELAIIGELEKCQTDFDGWMMLAELYVNQFQDIDEAERTICEICDEPTTTLSQVSIALHRLADWQLKLRKDPVAARRVLEEICKRMPGTHLAKVARQRIDRLPADSAELEEQQKVKTVHMPALSDDIDAAAGKDAPAINQEEALRAANQCVEKLKRDPNDVASREKLARIFAEQLEQPVLAIEQLELLLEMPEQPSAKTAEWLSSIAAWQIKYRGDDEAAKKILVRLVQEFPESPRAFAAQRRISLMEMEAKSRRSALVENRPTLAADELS